MPYWLHLYTIKRLMRRVGEEVYHCHDCYFCSYFRIITSICRIGQTAQQKIRPESPTSTLLTYATLLATNEIRLNVFTVNCFILSFEPERFYLKSSNYTYERTCSILYKFIAGRLGTIIWSRPLLSYDDIWKNLRNLLPYVNEIPK